MPIITAYTDHPTNPYVRVDINWADTPSVTHAGVSRVDVATGECTPLRPYICYNGWELLLSCGHGTFWDTEAPFDRPFYYVTQSAEAPCLLPEPLFLDTFTRTLVDSWGSTETGSLSPLPYTLAGGTNPGNYDVNGGKGRMTLDTDTIFRTASVDIGRTDFDLYATMSTDVVSLTVDVTSRIGGRFTDANNVYEGGINWSFSGNTVLAYIVRVVGGVETILAIDFAVGTYTPGAEWSMRFQGRGNDFKLKVWPTTLAEPAAWLFEVTDTPQPTLNSTRVALMGQRGTGNTNPVVILGFDNFTSTDECIPCAPVTADTSATPTTLANDGGFWLGDPVRPCHDRAVPLCFVSPVDPNCIPGQGIFFASMADESEEPNSMTVNPTNRRLPIAITRERRGIDSLLTLVTRTFDDRDAVKLLTQPGSPLLWRGPQVYGIADTYMDIGVVTVSRGLADHKIQPRVISLPFVTTNRPAGPSQGICGTRVVDICDLYPTWDDLVAAGFTWDDLIRGAASPESANPNRRTWDDVEAEFVDWDAVEAGGRTWTDLEVGD